MTARTFFALFAASTLLVGCGKEDTPPADAPTDTPTETTTDLTDAVKEAANEAGEAVKEAADEVKAATEEAVEEAEDDLAAQTEELKAKAVAVAEDRLTQLRAKLKELQGRLDSVPMPIKQLAQPLLKTANTRASGIEPLIETLKAAGANTWESADSTLTTALDALDEAIEAANAKLGG